MGLDFIPIQEFPFYLNLVGYKEVELLKLHNPRNEFYLNLVGYKARHFLALRNKSRLFYLNLVGYKVSNE